MQINELTITQFSEYIKNENNPDHLKAIAMAMAGDLKTTKETLIKISEMFGLYENGKFSENIKTKTVLQSISGAVMEAMSPFSTPEKLAAKYSFLKDIAAIAKKYENF